MQDTAGTIGHPFPVCEFRLESIPEMNYDAQGSPARGELCLRGNSLFEGYYKQEVCSPGQALQLGTQPQCTDESQHGMAVRGGTLHTASACPLAQRLATNPCSVKHSCGGTCKPS